MSKKKHKYTKGAKLAKGSVVWHLSADEATLAAKPHYNGFACGHGVQGDTKYNCAKMKRTWKNELRREGASRGSFDFYAAFPFCSNGRPRWMLSQASAAWGWVALQIIQHCSGLRAGLLRCGCHVAGVMPQVQCREYYAAGVIPQVIQATNDHLMYVLRTKSQRCATNHSEMH